MSVRRRLWDGDDHPPCHHPTGAWDGKERQPGERRQALCLICSPGSANFMNHVWGRDMGRRELWGEECRLCRETGISFERGLGMEERADDAILDIILCVRHPRVRRCCRSASLHGTIGGKRWGEAMRECGVRGRDDLSCNEPWVNSRNFQISMRQNFLSSILWVWGKYWNPISSRIIERPHRLFAFASLSDAKISEI